MCLCDNTVVMRSYWEKFVCTNARRPERETERARELCKCKEKEEKKKEAVAEEEAEQPNGRR